jgi:hypothetical protein
MFADGFQFVCFHEITWALTNFVYMTKSSFKCLETSVAEPEPDP